MAEVLQDIDPRNHVQELNVHGNNLQRLDGEQLAKVLPNLTDLNCSSNDIQSMAGVTKLSGLRTLTLSGNRIERIEGLSGLIRLERLGLAFNAIHSLAGLSAAYRSPLNTIDLRGNRISSVKELGHLIGLNSLRVRPPRSCIPGPDTSVSTLTMMGPAPVVAAGPFTALGWQGWQPDLRRRRPSRLRVLHPPTAAPTGHQEAASRGSRRHGPCGGGSS